MQRRQFFRQLASGLIVASAPALFLPKIVKPKWKALADGTRDYDELSKLWDRMCVATNDPKIILKAWELRRAEIQEQAVKYFKTWILNGEVTARLRNGKILSIT
jgi:hypothetical protein